MRRRAFLGLAAVAAAAGAGCTASALPSPGLAGDDPDVACPAVLDVDRTVCPGVDGPLTVERSSATVAGDAWSLVVSVTNGSDATVGLNPYAWSVLRRTADGWEQVAPEAHIEPWTELGPGSTYAWQLTPRADELADVDQRVTVDLRAGTYAFGVPVTGAERVGAVAAFEVAD